MKALNPDVYVAQFDEQNRNPSTSKLSRWISTRSRVLEIGCASGFFTRYLVETKKCTVVGVEYNPDAAAIAARWAPIHVLDIEQPGAFQDCGSGFDVIVFGDVLEHLHDPQGTLECVKGLLSPSGVVLVSVPNIAHYSVRLSLLQGKFDYTENGLLDRTHLRFFTMRSALRMFQQAGYYVQDWDITMSYTYLGRFLGTRGWIYNPMLALMKVWPNLFGYQLIFRITSQ